MFTSSADVFRTRQAVCDLLRVVHSHRSAVDRLGATGTDRSDIISILNAGCRIDDFGTRAFSSLLFAAAMPEEDFGAFIAATSILLADRLQGGQGDDDLYWNYEAFSEHYRLADAPVRAALMNGFRLGYELDRIKLPDLPPPETCLTMQKENVLQMLSAEGEELLVEAIQREASAKTAGAAWTAAVNRPLTTASKVGYRYLYERPASIAPHLSGDVELIPWA